MQKILLAVVVLSMVQPVKATDHLATVERLRCEYRIDPLGIDTTQPRLCWEIHDLRRGANQTAYHVLVASSPEKLAADQGDLWDSALVHRVWISR